MVYILASNEILEVGVIIIYKMKYYFLIQEQYKKLKFLVGYLVREPLEQKCRGVFSLRLF